MNFRYPFDGQFPITSPFGMRNGALHTGTDFGCPMYTVIRAAADGTVQYVAQEYDAGNTITLRHEGTFESRYLHLAGFSVSQGDTVSAGQAIALSDNTGASTGAHLHFEIRTDHDTPVDPIPYLTFSPAPPPPPPPPPSTNEDDMFPILVLDGQYAGLWMQSGPVLIQPHNSAGPTSVNKITGPPGRVLTLSGEEFVYYKGDLEAQRKLIGH